MCQSCFDSAGIKAASASAWLNALSAHIGVWNAGYHYSRNYTKAIDVEGSKLANCQGWLHILAVVQLPHSCKLDFMFSGPR
jgi:hypothetical protein